MMSRRSLMREVSEAERSTTSDESGAAGSGAETVREPTREELIERIRASNRRARAIRGTEADPLVQVQRALDRWEALDEALAAERLRRARRRLLWPFG